MHQSIATVVEAAIAGNDSSREDVQAAFSALMDGQADPIDVAALLTALATKGESIDDLAGAASAMSARAARITSRHERLLDTCGTGGDRLHTFNISTATALVAAGCGIPVAKHGNRSVSSSSGSSDVLAALGVTVDLPPDAVASCLDEIGIGFCFAPLFHSAMKHAAPVRQQLGLRTIFNLVGPLTNPAQADCQLLGANSDQSARLLAGALQLLGRPRALVVCGNNQLDEVALWGTTLALEVDGERDEITEHEWSARDFGLPECEAESLRVDSPDASAGMIRGVLEGQGGAARNIVVANTAAALVAFQGSQSTATDSMTDTLQLAAERAQAAIDDGLAAAKLAALVDVSGRLA